MSISKQESQRCQKEKVIKIAFWRGLGREKIEGKLSIDPIFLGKFHDNKIWKCLQTLLSEILLSLLRQRERESERGTESNNSPGSQA